MTNRFLKHWRLILLAIGVFVLLGILYALRIVLLPFAVGLVLAYLLMPFVSWLENHLPPKGKWPGSKRVISVLVAFLILLGIIGGFGFLVVTAIIDAAVTLMEYAPSFVARGVLEGQIWFQGITENLPVEIQQEVNDALIDAGFTIGNYIRDGFTQAVTNIPNTFSAILGFAVLPFFLFYIMKDSDRLKKGYVAAVTPDIARHTRNIANIIEKVLGRYIRAQIMLGVIVAYFTFIGLWLLQVLQVQYALTLAMLAGVTELIPTLGPWIGGAVAVVITLAVAPEKAIWVLVLFVGIQAIENSLLVPKIQSAYLRIHPAIMIFLLVMGAYLAGFWGLLLIGPLAATLVEVFNYVRAFHAAQGLQPPSEPEAAAS